MISQSLFLMFFSHYLLKLSEIAKILLLVLFIDQILILKLISIFLLITCSKFKIYYPRKE